MRLPWDGTSGLALEPSDGSGLAGFLAHHRPCGGGIDVRPVLAPDGEMIRVTCSRCGRAIEAPAASWEGLWDERTPRPPGRRRRFEPSGDSLARRRQHIPPARVDPVLESDRVPRWRLALTVFVVIAWTACGLLLMGSAISH
jgi:hypothetical protein